MKITCSVETVERKNEHGYLRAAVVVTCSKCDAQEESWGTSPSSIRRCCVMLKENCPMGENNYYSVEEGEED